MRIVSLLLVTMLLQLAAHAETFVEPTVFDARLGPLGIDGYEDRTRFTWSRGSEWTSFEVRVPFHALVAGLTVGAMVVGTSLFLRRRTSQFQAGR